MKDFGITYLNDSKKEYKKIKAENRREAIQKFCTEKPNVTIEDVRELDKLFE